MRTRLQRLEREPRAAILEGASPVREAVELPTAGRRTPARTVGRDIATKRLLVVSSHFPPERAAGVHRILRLVRQARAAAWPVTVLTVHPQHYRAGTPLDEGLLDRLPHGIEVYRTRALRYVTAAARGRHRLRQAIRTSMCRLLRPFTPNAPAPGAPRQGARVGPAKRPFIDSEIGWLLPALRAGTTVVARHRPEVIFSSAPPFTCHLIAGWLARRHKIRWVADFRDPFARSPWGGQALADSWRGWLRRQLERLVVERADAVVLNTRPLRDDFARHYGPRLAHKFHAVTNGYDLEVVAPYIGRAPRQVGRLVMTHAGSLYRRRDPRPLLHAVAAAIAKGRVAADGLELHFVGSISPEFRIAETISSLGLESVVRLTPPVSHEMSLEHLAQADVLVVIQPDTHLQVPVKLYEYLPFRKPILTLAPSGALSTIVEESGLGLVVSPDEAGAVEEAICQLYEHRHRLAERFPPDSESIDQYDGTVVSRRLQEILEAV